MKPHISRSIGSLTACIGGVLVAILLYMAPTSVELRLAFNAMLTYVLFSVALAAAGDAAVDKRIARAGLLAAFAQLAAVAVGLALAVERDALRYAFLVRQAAEGHANELLNPAPPTPLDFSPVSVPPYIPAWGLLAIAVVEVVALFAMYVAARLYLAAERPQGLERVTALLVLAQGLSSVGATLALSSLLLK